MKSAEYWAKIINGGLSSWLDYGLALTSSHDALVDAFQRAQAEAYAAGQEHMKARCFDYIENEFLGAGAHENIEAESVLGVALDDISALPIQPLPTQDKEGV